MNSICLSVAPNIRCGGLTRNQNIALAIPPAVELFFSFTLALTNSPIRSRKRWILVCDGLSYFLLALLDFLSHIIPQISSDKTTFAAVDFVLGGASFLPILAYILFLYLFARSNLVTLLPTRFGRVMRFSLAAIIPAIIAFNELGSLLGISHGQVKLPNISATMLGVGFLSVPLQRIALFFSSGTLALMAIFQAALFFLSFIRVVRAFISEHRAESSMDKDAEPNEIYLFRGLGWLAAGLKLGAIESVLGFANISFAIAMTRRVLRLFGRSMIIIGIIKGINMVENFVQFESDVMALRRPASRSSDEPKRFSLTMISDPRSSTFRELSPQAASFHVAQGERRARKPGPSPLSLGVQSSYHGFEHILRPRHLRDRVTVHYDGKAPPVLNVRFSAIDLHAVPPIDKEYTQLSPVMEGSQEGQRSSYDLTPLPPTARPLFSTFAPLTMSRSLESIEAVRDLANRFPGLPPRLVPGRPPPVHLENKRDSDADWKTLARMRSQQRREQLESEQREKEKDRRQQQGQGVDVSPVNSIKRKPAPSMLVNDELSPTTATSPPSEYGAEQSKEPASHFYSDDSDAEDTSDIGRDTILMRSGRSPATTLTPGLTRTPASTLDRDTLPSPLHTPPPWSPGQPQRRHGVPLLSRALRRRALPSEAFFPLEPTIDEEQKSNPTPTASARASASTSASSAPRPSHETAAERVRGAWLRNGPLTDLHTTARPRSTGNSNSNSDDDSEAVIDEAWQRAGLTRIKSVNNVRVHTTPQAQQEFDVRGSMFAVQEDDLGLPASLVEALGSGSGSALRAARTSVVSASLRRPARGDSDILGEEETRLVREIRYI